MGLILQNSVLSLIKRDKIRGGGGGEQATVRWNLTLSLRPHLRDEDAAGMMGMVKAPGGRDGSKYIISGNPGTPGRALPRCPYRLIRKGCCDLIFFSY